MKRTHYEVRVGFGDVVTTADSLHDARMRIEARWPNGTPTPRGLAIVKVTEEFPPLNAAKRGAR